MKVVAIADLHGNEPAIPPCDLLLIGGDLLMGAKPAAQQWMLRDVIGPWMVERMLHGVKNIVGCAGNHDFIFQKKPDLVPKMPWTYLEDEAVEIEGFKIWGSPWQLPFYDWAFNLPEEELEKKWKMIPDDIDVLLTHSPPYGYGDYIRGQGNVGSKSLLERVNEIKPKLHVFGHIHVARGIDETEDTIFANASLVDQTYRVKHKPMVFEL
jgi:Icc-related predicted phosphoesterase